ncbi:MAG: hypothetical protein WB763_13855 [Terriglobia bacterium]|jgi:hypothetical protein
MKIALTHNRYQQPGGEDIVAEAPHLPGTFYFPFVGCDGRQTLDPGHPAMLASEGLETPSK